MFQFPRFASSPYVFRTGYPRKGGFPHSDIRGSTIARISPRLFAACHVLHRLLAPRHPPNALISLHIHTTARAQGQITPHTITLLTDSSASHHISAQTNTLTLVMRHNTPIHLHHEKEQHLKPAPQPTSGATAQSKIGFSGSQESSSSANHNHPPWRRSDSNRRPPACKAGALPLSYAPLGETRSFQLVTTNSTQASVTSAQLKPLRQHGLEPRFKNTSPVIDRATMPRIAGRFSIPPGDLFCAPRKINGPGRT